ncbi:helix-turn-helix domain-containing protein [Deinococcus marmoris]|uniref:helix-turn-helix domain-containing protein n=1 Tax=Deinococcus marmoris TaxID=249408 RepID=UPI0012DC520F|nr:helix-turn-helix transcriptional regulator [Deinococcus marmoris]
MTDSHPSVAPAGSVLPIPPNPRRSAHWRQAKWSPPSAGAESEVIWAPSPGQTFDLAVLPPKQAGQMLARRRESRNLRLVDVAAQIGQLSGETPPSAQYLSAIEHGHTKLANSKYLRYLTQVLDLSASDLAAITGVIVEDRRAVDVFAAHAADLAPEQPSGQRAYTLGADVLIVDHGERGLVPGGRYLIEQGGAVRQARACAAPEGQMLLLVDHLLVEPETVQVLGRVLFVGQYT